MAKALDAQGSIAELAQGFSEDQWSIWASLNGLDLEPSQCKAEVMNARSQFPEEVLVSLIEASLMSVEEGTKDALLRMKQAEPLRGKMASWIAGFFGDVLNDLVIRLQYDYPVDAAFWQRLGSLWGPNLESALFEGLEEAAITVNFDLINEPARAWARERAFDLVNLEGDQSVIRSISGQLDTIKEQLSTGELPWLELRNRLGEIFSDERARRIADTEITNAFTTSGRLAAKEEGMTSKRSLSAHDHLVCLRVCVPNEQASWIPIDDPYPFSWGGATVYGPSFHVSCRCGEAYR